MSRWLSDENAHNVSNISVSFLIWTVVYLVFYSRKTSQRIKQKSPEAVRLKRQELGVKIASILHAIYTAYGAHICLGNMNGEPDFFVKHGDAEHYANVSAGFFIADLILCVILIEEHGITFVIHAISALAGALYVSMTGVGHYYFLNLLMFEASTPFLHIRSLLLEYGYAGTPVANINNLIFMITFGYFRLYRGIPIILQMCGGLITENRFSPGTTIFFITCGTLMSCLNIMWFGKILKSAYKTMIT